MHNIKWHTDFRKHASHIVRVACTESTAPKYSDVMLLDRTVIAVAPLNTGSYHIIMLDKSIMPS